MGGGREVIDLDGLAQQAHANAIQHGYDDSIVEGLWNLRNELWQAMADGADLADELSDVALAALVLMHRLHEMSMGDVPSPTAMISAQHLRNLNRTNPRERS